MAEIIDQSYPAQQTAERRAHHVGRTAGPSDVITAYIQQVRSGQGDWQQEFWAKELKGGLDRLKGEVARQGKVSSAKAQSAVHSINTATRALLPMMTDGEWQRRGSEEFWHQLSQLSLEEKNRLSQNDFSWRGYEHIDRVSKGTLTHDHGQLVHPTERKSVQQFSVGFAKHDKQAPVIDTVPSAEE